MRKGPLGPWKKRMGFSYGEVGRPRCVYVHVVANVVTTFALYAREYDTINGM